MKFTVLSHPRYFGAGLILAMAATLQLVEISESASVDVK